MVVARQTPTGSIDTIEPHLREPDPSYQVNGCIDIAVASSDVWRLLSDFHGLESWTSRVSNVYAIGTLKQGLGTARNCHVRGLGTIDEIVTVWDEESRLGYRVSPVGVLGRSQSLWQIEGTGTDTCSVRLRLDYDVRFGVLGRILHAMVLRQILNKAVLEVLGRLKAHLE